MKNNKRKLTLENGRIVDCGIKEFDELQEAIKKEDPKKIALKSLKLLMSSEDMMSSLFEESLAMIKKYKLENKK